MKKKEKILILRTAKMQVVDLLMEQIDRDSEVTFLVQSNIVKEMKNKYPFAEVISINATYFSYESFCKNVKLHENFDTIYVLASGMNFDGYEEVFRIVECIKYRQLILFNGKGEKNVEQHTVANELKDSLYSVFAQIYMKGIEVWYKYRGRKVKF